MNIQHINLSHANAFIKAHSLRKSPILRHRFSIGYFDNGRLVGIAVVGKPHTANIHGRNTVEILCLCTNGTPRVAHTLRTACIHVAKALGYAKITTRTIVKFNKRRAE